MSVLEFIASITSSLAWPGAVLAAVVVIRKPLKDLLSGPISRLHAGPSGLQVEWDRQATKTRADLSEVRQRREAAIPDASRPKTLGEELRDLAASSPQAAVAEAFSSMHDELQALIAANDALEDSMSGLDTHALADLALEKGIIDPQTYRSIEGMIVLHALAHSPFTTLSSERAREYLALADGVMYVIRGGRDDRPR